MGSVSDKEKITIEPLLMLPCIPTSLVFVQILGSLDNAAAILDIGPVAQGYSTL